MTDKLKQIIKEETTKLLKDAHDVINSFGWENISENIGKKYLLDESEINDLQVETLLVLVGIEDLDYYAKNIEDNIGTSKEEAEKIANEVAQKIFIPLYDTLSEKIKKNLKNIKPDWKQNLDFTLSGGDYSVFIEKGNNTNISTETVTLDNSSKITDIKNKFII